MPNVDVDTIARIEGSLSNGGWKITGSVFNDADRLHFYQGMYAWFEMYTSSGWDAQIRPAFRGHLLPEPWEKTFQSSVAPWSAVLAQELMKRGKIQGIFYKHVASAPANRHQIITMKYAKIVYEIISGHCNLMVPGERATYDTQLWSGAFTSPAFNEGFLFLDIDIAGSTAVDNYLVKEGGFWERIQEIAEIEFFLAYVDLFNTFHYIPHPMFGATLPTAVFTITSAHLLQPLKVTPRNTEEVGQVQLHGTTPQGLQLTGKFPAQPTAGPIVVRSGYLATSSSLMTTIATRMYKFSNRDYRIEAKLQGAVGLMLALLDRVSVTYTSSADGISWSAKKFWIDGITVEIMSDFNAVTTLVLDAEAA